jgi:hypothetical protein
VIKDVPFIIAGNEKEVEIKVWWSNLKAYEISRVLLESHGLR